MGFLRLLLAVTVILAHAGPLPIVGKMINGLIAVQAFFILSGFYMALVLNEKYTDAATFYWNRASRIYSGYWIALIIAVPLAKYSDLNWFTTIFRADWDIASKLMMLSANLFIIGSDAMFFFYPGPNGMAFVADFQAQDPKLYVAHYLGAAWSLPVEFAFYLIAPFIVRSIPKILVIAAASLIIRLVTYQLFGMKDPWTYRFIPSEMMLFMGGALAYHAMTKLRTVPLPAHAGNVAFGVAIACTIFYKFIFNGTLWPYYAMLVIAIPFIFTRPANWLSGLDVYAGELAYMVYLSHMIVLIALRTFIGSDPNPMIVIAITLGISDPLHRIASRLDHRIRAQFRAKSPRHAALA